MGLKTMNEMTVWDHLITFLTAALAWLAGESGRVLIASGLGGLVRWIGDEKKSIRTGMLSWIGGGVTGYYMWPLLLKAPAGFGFSEFAREPENIAMAGFLMGAIGVSGVKITVALIEKRARRLADAE